MLDWLFDHLFAILIIGVLVLVGINVYDECANTIGYEEYIDKAIVIEVDYEPQRLVSAKPVMFSPEKYNTTLEYNGEYHVIEDKELYDISKDNIGATVQVSVYKKLYKDREPDYRICVD